MGRMQRFNCVEGARSAMPAHQKDTTRPVQPKQEWARTEIAIGNPEFASFYL
jgi:hypothetical protein